MGRKIGNVLMKIALVCICAVAVIAIIVLMTPSIALRVAQRQLELGKRYQAYALFEMTVGVDSLEEERYQIALQYFKEGDYEAATVIFEGLNNYKFCASQINEIKKITRRSDEEAQQKYAFLKETNVGDTITFGSYEQDNNVSNGREPIEWIVLSKRNGKLLCISKYSLDTRVFDNSGRDVTWRKSDLRLWLNSSFYDNAFSSSEKSYVEYSFLGRYKGSSDQDEEVLYDYVSILSEGEAASYYKSDEERMVKPTPYALNNGAYVGDRGDAEGCAWWWLRSDGGQENTTVAVHNLGNIYGDIYSDMDFCTVRPVVWLVDE